MQCKARAIGVSSEAAPVAGRNTREWDERVCRVFASPN